MHLLFYQGRRVPLVAGPHDLRDVQDCVVALQRFPGDEGLCKGLQKLFDDVKGKPISCDAAHDEVVLGEGVKMV